VEFERAGLQLERLAVLVAGALLLLLAPSRSALGKTGPDQAPVASVPGWSPGYLDWLAGRGRATQRDLLWVLVRLVAPPAASQEGARAGRPHSEETALDLLRQQRVLSPGGRLDLDASVERGVAALLFSRALGVRGGVSGRLFGRGRRAAYQELVFKTVMRAGGEHWAMSGGELVGTLDRARWYQKVGRQPR
jgi:hypothetical protein